MVTPGDHYRDVANMIRQAIHEGVYPRGSLLPTEDKLAEELHVNRATVNKALGVLKREGLVYVHMGVGTYVHKLPPILRDAAVRHSRAHRERGGMRGSLASELAQLGYELSSANTVGPGHPPLDVAEVLGVEAGIDSVIIRARRMKAEDIPIQIATSYIPRSIAEGTPIAELDPGIGGISSRLAELGYAQAELEENIRVRPPTPDELRFLRMIPDQWVYEIFHIGWTAADQAVKVTTYVMPTYQWNLRYRYPADPS
ncbi:GntR family transcriptional regulator [Nonomuraea turcica]|uniref:GntR family transcriptional regulator n=1 Tax=Nonomuraea sp. G32 TaxID=3067274 RepID=UPI00273CCC01|nr:GntR family transcriptional regulator [Nonomuraea sp. G32]MDP4511754.1 GntR family transcriptional regulator [Nonomuraea sp. G32]